MDTKTIRTADGPKRFNVAVIGNPCDHPVRHRHRLSLVFSLPFCQRLTPFPAALQSALTKPFIQPFDKRETTIAREAAEVSRRRRRRLRSFMRSIPGNEPATADYSRAKHSRQLTTPGQRMKPMFISRLLFHS